MVARRYARFVLQYSARSWSQCLGERSDHDEGLQLEGAYLVWLTEVDGSVLISVHTRCKSKNPARLVLTMAVGT